MLKKAFIFATASATLLAGCGTDVAENINGTSGKDVDNTFNSETNSELLDGVNLDLAEEDGEGVLITSEELDEDEWTADSDNPEILHSDNTNEVIFMGALFAAAALMKQSDYYKSDGVNKSRLAYSDKFKSNKSGLAYTPEGYKAINTEKVKGAIINKTYTNSTTGAKPSSNFSSKGKSGISSGGKGGGGS